MAQGLLKKPKSAPTSAAKRPSALGPKKGQGAIAPKKAKLVKQNKMNKKISGGLTARTEQNLAKRAGHLEMLAGGKKDGKGGKKKN